MHIRRTHNIEKLINNINHLAEMHELMEENKRLRQDCKIFQSDINERETAARILLDMSYSGQGQAEEHPAAQAFEGNN